MVANLYVRGVKVQIAQSARFFPMSTLDLRRTTVSLRGLLSCVGLILMLIPMVAPGSGAASGERVGGMTRSEVYQQVRELSALGRSLFADPALSASGKLSCASCHNPDHAFGPLNALPVQPG